MNPYSYMNEEFDFNLCLKETTSKWLHYAVDFPTAHPTCYQENNTVYGEYFQPREVNHAPLAILVHGMGDRSIIPLRFLAKTLVKKGVACFALYLVFHSRRMPQALRESVPVLTPQYWSEGYRISVIDVRQIIDWASDRPEINKEQIAIIGMSLGGFVSAIAMGVDKRISAGVFLISGGNSERICWGGKNSVVKKSHSCTEVECHHLHSYYPQYLADVAEKGLENVTPAKECFLTDPMTFAFYLRKRPILMLNALWDEAIPRQATLDFWQACDKPAIAWFPATHAGIWFWYPFIGRKIAGFLTSTFGMQG